MYSQPTSPQSIGGVLDAGFSLYRHSLKQTFAFAAIGALASAPVSRMMQGAAGPGAMPAVGAGAGVSALVAMLISVLIFAALIARIYAVQNGRQLAAADALTIGARRMLPLIGVGILYAVAVGIGMLLLVIPGIYVMIALGFAMFATVVHSRGVIDSFKYSLALVRGRWWRTAVLLTIIGIVMFVLYMVYGFVLGVALAFGGEENPAQPLPWYADYILAPLLAGLLTPLMYSVAMAVYADLKLRHEGADLAERVAATAA